MLLTNEQREELAKQLGRNIGWVIRSNTSFKDIEKCGGEATADPTTNTCLLCVAANKTAYRQNNLWSLTHPNCKCKSVNGNVSVEVDFPISKFTKYWFVNPTKSGIPPTMGFRIEDSEELRQTLSAVIKRQYEEGTYEMKYLDSHGQHVQIKTAVIGKRDHTGEIFKCHIGCVLWPNGKIKVATPLIKED